MIACPSRPRSARWGVPTLALAALLLAALLPMSAKAAPATGQATIVAQPGKAKTDLLTQGAKLRGGAKGKAGRVTLPVTDLRFGKATRAELAGRIVFNRGKRRAVARDLSVRVAAKQALVVGKIGKQTLAIFRASGQSESVANAIGLSKAPLALTGDAAKALAPRLGLDKVKPGRLGLLSLNAVQNDLLKEEPKGDDEEGKQEESIPPPPNPCALTVASTIPGTAPAPAAPPVMDSPSDITGGMTDWAFKTSLQGYILGSGGALVPVAPATMPNPPVGSFRFPTGSGSYAINNGDNDVDDQAVVNGAGEIRLCNTPHEFTITLSNPTVTINGSGGRLTADVETNMFGEHMPVQRVDLATLAVDDVSPFYNENARTVTWTDIPVNLTAAGADALRLCTPGGPPGPCNYETGSPLDPLSVEVKTSASVKWPFNSACTLTLPPATNNPPEWPSTPAAALPLPALDGAEALDTAEIRWGMHNSLRSQVQSNGAFNLSGDAERSDPTTMTGEGKFFTWPSDEALYDPDSESVVIQGRGTVGLCNTSHRYGTVLANPTVVIGEDGSRLTFDVHSRIRTHWTSGRVDVAFLDLGDAVVTTAPGPDSGEETITWTFPDYGVNGVPGGGDDDKDSANSTVKTSVAGSSALAIFGGFFKSPGTPLNALRVSIERPADE